MGRLSHGSAGPQQSRGRTTDEELGSQVALVMRMPMYVKDTWTRVPAGALCPVARLVQPEFRALGAGRESLLLNQASFCHCRIFNKSIVAEAERVS